MTTDEYDLIVIGAGGAGSTAAGNAAEMGKHVALIERDKLGGTCLNYGCDPTKTLLHTASVFYHASHASGLGLRISQAKVDWEAVQAHVRQVQETIRGGTLEQASAGIAAQGIDLFMGEAMFTSPHEIRVNGVTLRSKRFVIATGTVAMIPEIDGLSKAGYITNVEAVSLPELPKRLVVIGGGPIGLEFAQMFSRLGAQVTVLERGEQPLPREDPELAMLLCSQLTAEGIRLEFGAEMRCGDIDEHGKHIHLHGKDGKKEDLTADQLLIAVGRKPALDKLNLEAAGVQYTEDGVTTDATLRTNVPHIWAAGDITSKYQFTHVASDQGKLVAHNVFARKPKEFDDRVIPWVTFTDPELARVGMLEAELKEAKIEYRVGRAYFNKLDRAIANNQTFGSVKLLADMDGNILGGHILSANAGELIAPIIYAMRFGLTAKKMAGAMLPYPTMAEAVRWAASQL
ncbi:FAD-dependent oxidoreductase [Candidatus Villigracilis affinis]|uniref:dihydrolipoyl dehydrogenase family protein n=1 Tax=Candidatus Villigracilis affinis TaxID=3140682 RepID=UPI001B59523E|nr:FAD-dependent oxidoreductase [Anaerolineales bacterium]MBP8047133.1 FAD-dependent oxidoreductase [Anaerolineales bacterium]